MENCELSSEELKKAIIDRADVVYEGIPIITIFDYYENLNSPNADRRNDFLIKSFIDVFRNHRPVTESNYYDFYVKLAVSFYTHKIQELLNELAYKEDIQIQLVSVPEIDEPTHLERWPQPIVMLGKELKMINHFCSYQYFFKGKNNSTEEVIPDGNFDRSFFIDEDHPEIVPHIILITDVVSEKNINRLVETKRKLRDIGCEVLGVVALGRMV